jgi:tryptophan synthase alpha chain
MQPKEAISAALRSAKADGQPAIVAYMTAGFPTAAQFPELLRMLAASADVVEIGVPFTDPMADGATIQRSSRVALQQGASLKWIFAQLEKLSPPVQAPLLLMSYLNPLLAFGLERLAATSVRAGVAGFIIPDLPFEESAPLRAALSPHGLALVQMVTPVTPVERLAMLCRASEGFVYAVTMTGTTGKTVAVPQDVLAYLDRVRKVSPLPVCAGFGIRNREQVQRLAGHVDGIVVGSALVEVLERGEDPGEFLRGLQAL